MWCIVSQPNSVIIEVILDPKAKGQECLEKVCGKLGISNESDYFGLKFHNSKGEELWLNLRNAIERQVSGVAPFRFELRVKFWVPPHLLLQEATRHQFFLDARQELLDGRIRVSDLGVAARVTALLFQADATNSYTLEQVCEALCPSGPNSTKTPQDLMKDALQHLSQLKMMKPHAAEYWLLKEISLLDSFGQEVFTAKHGSTGCITPSLFSSTPTPCVGVGPHGVTLYHTAEKQSIPWTAIQHASSHRRIFRLTYLGHDTLEKTIDIKLDSSQSASGLYRAVTEKHAFYSCETVRSAVTAQFIRDLKGTIVSIFNEDTSLGKKYVFDIRRTCREVYDNARRALYQTGSCLFPPPEDIDPETALNLNSEGKDDEESIQTYNSGISKCSGLKCQESKRRLTNLLDAMSCRVCMDRGIDTAFFPCGHVMTCSLCAARCERCPLCRGPISQAERIYLPVELTATLQADSEGTINSTTSGFPFLSILPPSPQPSTS